MSQRGATNGAIRRKKRSRIGHGQSINSPRTAAHSFEHRRCAAFRDFCVFLLEHSRALNQFDGQRESQRGASGRASSFFALRVGNLSNSIMKSAAGVVVRKNMSGTHRMSNFTGFYMDSTVSLIILSVVMWCRSKKITHNFKVCFCGCSLLKQKEI